MAYSPGDPTPVATRAFPRLLRRKAERERESQRVHLPVTTLAGVILVFIVRLNLEAFSNRHDTTERFRCSAPLFSAAVVVEFNSNVRCNRAGADLKVSLGAEPVTITP